MPLFVLANILMFKNVSLVVKTKCQYLQKVKSWTHHIWVVARLLGSVCNLGQKLTDRDCITLRRRAHLEPS